MGISDLADGITRRVESLGDSVTQSLFEPVIRLGVTGLSRAGKTVFITSLVANLLDRGRMPALTQRGRIHAAFLQPQPDDTIPRFPYEAHLDALTGPSAQWPNGTSSVSQLRLSFRVQTSGILSGLRGMRTVHLDIVDYPGEWLLDLGLMDKTYRTWSDAVLAHLPNRPGGAAFLEHLGRIDPAQPHTQQAAEDLARHFTDHLHQAKEAGFSDCSPGRFLLPGEMAGSPVLTFAPLPESRSPAPRGSLGREMERRFDAYKREVVKPFFRDHFARIDRQVVLADVLSAIHAGPAALDDLRRAMADILAAFRPGRTSWLGHLLGSHRVERILFAATKADHLHHTQHARLSAITTALLREARDRADFAGADTQALSIAALRTTTEAMLPHDGQELAAVRGTLADGRNVVLYPGELPQDPAQLLAPARAGQQHWLNDDYDIMTFAPASVSLNPGEGPPHIRLDRAAEFLIGDKL